MRTLRGSYTALTFHHALYQVAPADVRSGWDEVAAIQTRLQQARADLAPLTASVESAQKLDEQATDLAVAKGKPLPALTAPTAVQALEDKKREIPALERIANDTETRFMALVRANRQTMLDTVQSALSESLEAVDDAVTTVKEKVDDVGLLTGMWNWLRSDLERKPNPTRIDVTVNGQRQPFDRVLDTIVAAVRLRDPATVLAAVAAREEERANRAKATADGMLLDPIGREAVWDAAE